jgi:hypothetical protein
LKNNDTITYDEIVKQRGWKKECVLYYLGTGKHDYRTGDMLYKKSVVIATEDKLTKNGIVWRGDA